MHFLQKPPVNSFSQKNSFVFLLVFYLALASNIAFGQSPYQLYTGREIGLMGGGAALYGASLALGHSVDPLTPAQVAALNRSDINAFDRNATFHYDPSIAHVSDFTLYTNAGLPVLLTLALKPMRQDVKTLGAMYIETLLLANGVESTVKALSQRPRPYVFNPDVPLDEKLTRDARQSFFSGHATTAFATAVLTSEVFRHYFPESKLKAVVWIGTLGLASATCVMRYESGRHYKTDLLVGAAFGSLVGWGIPKLHEVKNRSSLGSRLDISPWSTGTTTGLSVRLRFHSSSPVNQ